MSVGCKNRKEPPAPLDTPLWTLTKNGRSLTAWTRVSSDVEGVQIRYTLNGEFIFSMGHYGTSLARMKQDVEAKRAELEEKGWGDAT